MQEMCMHHTILSSVACQAVLVGPCHHGMARLQVEMGGACGTYGGTERIAQGFGRET